MPRIVLSYALWFVTTICFPQYSGFRIEGNKKKVTIPVEIVNNLVVVPVVLNGQAPLKFILDTGVRTTVLTQKTYSDILGLAYSKEIFISGPGGEKLVDAFVTDNVTLDLPGVHGEGHSMLVLEKDYLELRNYLGTEVHGILGYELFSRFIVRMDYHKKRIVLLTPERFRKKRRYQTMEVKVQDTKPFIMAKTKLNDSTSLDVKLLIDTGASHGLVLEPESDPAIRVPQKSLESIIGRGLGGEIKGRIGRINGLELGRYKINEVIANFPDPDSYKSLLFQDDSLRRNGALGGEILSRFSIIFNYPHEEIYVKKNADFRKKFNYDMAGIIVKAKGARLRAYEITHLRNGSPGEMAGLKEGDLIISVNGTSTQSLNLNQINGFFNSKEGKRVVMEVNRDGQRVKAEFRLANQI
ncbi:MAG: aspartyl protease family protein [Cyclobacteriaceae bacterium]|nr:aspartyl protease family protein [Cyclobacteriaceae bacterium]MCB0498756.1 aspartyl protease family protein [Cyclobacteriaceae bacterium]MCB9237730.1 aspartyl protease family protein [Flammeovirgaceae bacterium]MCO5270168.1 aspartyl protease family protein [Cyclobacteriaceae bacterium]MCW5903747.1 aspartyl protease family protein [Cyclobacteriaceae bacterium]